ncbi:DUF4840 domain-containing protein, partial [Bacillus pumilus]
MPKFNRKMKSLKIISMAACCAAALVFN